MKKRLKWLAIPFLSGAVILTGCAPDRDGGAEESGGSSGNEEPDKPESLKIWANDEDRQVNAYKEITENFTEETGIEVEIARQDFDGQTEKISLDGPAGNGPDLFFQPHDRIGDIQLQGLASPLDAEDERLDEYQEEAIQAMTYDGELYGIPSVTETYALLYNKEILEEPPETLKELEEAAEEHTDAGNDEYGFLMEAANFYFTYPFVTAYGGYVFKQNEDGTYNTEDIGLATDGAVEGGKMIGSWYEEGYIPQGITADVMNGLFESGDVGAVVSGPWALRGYEEAIGEENLGVATLPTTEDGEELTSFSGVKGWMVSNFVEEDRKYWAEELALFMTNEESSEIYFETAGEVPTNTAVVESDLIQEDEYFAGFAEQTRYAEPMPNVPEMTQVWDPMADAHEYIAEGAAAKEVLEEAEGQIKEEIELQE
ncbi:extracellular solute-binding protein [Marinococcus halophilus]|uniref:extracellular solute-binding protein n=1 Tax=Marinococcus halophilus TaxID=1371 RepID=UPI0009A6BFA2|nr:extracellular solute-binding protein [Marinococcus halophilus]